MHCVASINPNTPSATTGLECARNGVREILASGLLDAVDRCTVLIGFADDQTSVKLQFHTWALVDGKKIKNVPLLVDKVYASVFPGADSYGKIRLEDLGGLADGVRLPQYFQKISQVKQGRYGSFDKLITLPEVVRRLEVLGKLWDSRLALPGWTAQGKVNEMAYQFFKSKKGSIHTEYCMKFGSPNSDEAVVYSYGSYKSKADVKGELYARSELNWGFFLNHGDDIT